MDVKTTLIMFVLILAILLPYAWLKNRMLEKKRRKTAGFTMRETTEGCMVEENAAEEYAGPAVKANHAAGAIAGLVAALVTMGGYYLLFGKDLA